VSVYGAAIVAIASQRVHLMNADSAPDGCPPRNQAHCGLWVCLRPLSCCF